MSQIFAKWNQEIEYSKPSNESKHAFLNQDFVKWLQNCDFKNKLWILEVFIRKIEPIAPVPAAAVHNHS